MVGGESESDVQSSSQESVWEQTEENGVGGARGGVSVVGGYDTSRPVPELPPNTVVRFFAQSNIEDIVTQNLGEMTDERRYVAKRCGWGCSELVREGVGWGAVSLLGRGWGGVQ